MGCIRSWLCHGKLSVEMKTQRSKTSSAGELKLYFKHQFRRQEEPAGNSLQSGTLLPSHIFTACKSSSRKFRISPGAKLLWRRESLVQIIAGEINAPSQGLMCKAAQRSRASSPEGHVPPISPAPGSFLGTRQFVPVPWQLFRLSPVMVSGPVCHHSYTQAG